MFFIDQTSSVDLSAHFTLLFVSFSLIVQGNFFWPVKELILTEGASATATPTSRTVAGAPGQACADVCFKNYPTSTQYCDSAAMKSLTSTAALSTALNGVSVAVRSPLLAACA